MADPYYKRCRCRGGDGKELGPACPKLRRADGTLNPRHGTWYFQLELAPGPGGKRLPPMRRGGFATREEAAGAREKAQAVKRLHGNPADRGTTGAYLEAWLKGRRSIKKSTARRYENIVRLYLVPLVGHIPLAQLQQEDVIAMFTTIREWNDALAEGKPVRKHQHHVSPATMQRIRATLRKALNDAGQGRIQFNPAVKIEMDSTRRPKPKVWTPERTAAFWQAHEDHMAGHPGADPFKTWREAERRPGPVMVWTARQAGAFLDFIEGDELQGLYETIVATGIRRGEACGLPWTDVSLGENAHIEVGAALLRMGAENVKETPKSEAGGRIVSLDAATALMLRERKKQLPALRMKWGSAWTESGLVFTRADGSALNPNDATDHLARLEYEAHLPPVTVSGLRHEHATLALKAKTDIKVVQERLGHSSRQITSDTYTSVLLELDQEAAEAVAAIIPRSGKRASDLRTESPRSPGQPETEGQGESQQVRRTS